MITIWVHKSMLDNFVKLLSNDIEEGTIIPFFTYQPYKLGNADQRSYVQLLITYDEYNRLIDNV